MSQHAHELGGSRRRLAIAFAITMTILLAEIVGAFVTGSLALLADAAHMLTDAGGLLIALLAATLAARPPNPRRTWGYARAEVLAAGAQAGLLLGVGVFAAAEGIRRLLDPPEVSPTGLLVFGVIGLAGNLAAIAVLTGGRHHSLNMRAAFLEVVADALGSVAVIVGAVVIATTGWQQADSVAALFICLIIVPRALTILREAGNVLLEATPPGLDLDDVRAHLVRLPHVVGVHDLHASRVSTGLPVLTAHVVIDEACFVDGHAPQLLDDLQRCVAEHFPVSVEHSTFQLEPPQHAEHESVAHH